MSARATHRLQCSISFVLRHRKGLCQEITIPYTEVNTARGCGPNQRSCKAVPGMRCSACHSTSSARLGVSRGRAHPEMKLSELRFAHESFSLHRARSLNSKPCGPQVESHRKQDHRHHRCCHAHMVPGRPRRVVVGPGRHVVCAANCVSSQRIVLGNMDGKCQQELAKNEDYRARR